MTNEAIVERIRQGHRELQTQLFEQNQGLLFKVANKYSFGCKEDREDLMQELALMLFQCADRYDPNRGANFVTFAVPWLKQCCIRYLDRNRLVIRLPANIQEQVKKIQTLEQQGLTDIEIMQAMCLTEKQFEELKQCENTFYQGCVPLSAPVNEDGQEEITLADVIPDPRNDFVTVEDALRDIEVRRLVNELEDPYKTVLHLRFDGELTHIQIAEKLGLNVYEVRRFIEKAYRLLQRKIERTELIEREAFSSSRVKRYLSGDTTSAVEATLGL